MPNRRLMSSALLIIIALLTLTACNLFEPIKVGKFAIQLTEQAIPRTKTEPICRALENAGYIVPYGTVLGRSDLEISQLRWVLYGTNGQILNMPHGKPYADIVIDWHIPADLNMLPNAVSQETVDKLAEEAKKICRIVEREAAKQGVGPIDVNISLFEVVVGLEVSYGQGPDLMPTSDCEYLTGRYRGKSIGLNPEGRTPGRCPSLYVPN